jgi:hypothetical protein
VAQLYFRALGSLFDASYDSQGYGGGILTLLHTGLKVPSYALFPLILQKKRFCEEPIVYFP